MQQLEKLMECVPELKVTYDAYMPKGLSGLYHKDHIRLNPENSYEKNVGILAEEIGHYLTSNGDITDYSDTNNMKQELVARREALKMLLPLDKLIECYENGIWGNVHEVCEYLEIDTQFFEYAIADYKKQFNMHIDYKGYRIVFEPLSIKKI